MNLCIKLPNLAFFAISNINRESKWKIKKIDEFQSILGKTDTGAVKRQI